MEAFEKPVKVLELSREEEQRASDLHKKAIFVECLGGNPIDDKAFRLLKHSGVTAINMSVGPTRTFRDAVISIFNMYDHCENKYPDMYTFGVSVESIKKTKKDGKIALIPGTQISGAIEEEEGLKLLRILHRMGLRILQLTYNERNSIGDGGGERTNCGLSNYGIEVVEEMNKLDMVIDLSHVGDATTMDAIEFSKDPLIFSHTACRSISHQFRGQPDENIKALAEKGGVMGIVAKTHFLTHQTDSKYIRHDINAYLDHIDKVVELSSANNIGIGLDIHYPLIRTREAMGHLFSKPFGFTPYDLEMNYQKLQVEGLDCIEDYPNITRGLVIRGYSDQEIIKILGGNFLRVFEKVWKK